MLPLGQAGHLHIKGPTVMKGYHGNNIATNDVMKDGWLATGRLTSLFPIVNVAYMLKFVESIRIDCFTKLRSL